MSSLIRGDHADLFLTAQERMTVAISELPTLKKDEIPLDDSCPICLNSFESIYEGRAQNEGDLIGLTVEPLELRGVTKLEGCGHIFCRLDMIEWIRGRHGTCPACRHQFANIRPISESDYESSDGDYIPGEDDEDEEDGFLDTDDFDADEFEFEDTDIDMSEELEVYLDVEVETDANGDADSNTDAETAWEGGDEDDGMENWGLSDGDGSESLSEGDIFVSGDEGSGEAEVEVDDAEVYGSESYLSANEGSVTEEPK